MFAALTAADLLPLNSDQYNSKHRSIHFAKHGCRLVPQALRGLDLSWIGGRLTETARFPRTLQANSPVVSGEELEMPRFANPAQLARIAPGAIYQ